MPALLGTRIAALRSCLKRLYGIVHVRTRTGSETVLPTLTGSSMGDSMVTLGLVSQSDSISEPTR
jgi:hypothetical protein